MACSRRASCLYLLVNGTSPSVVPMTLQTYFVSVAITGKEANDLPCMNIANENCIMLKKKHKQENT